MLINIVALLAYISIHTFYCPRMGRTLIKKMALVYAYNHARHL